MDELEYTEKRQEAEAVLLEARMAVEGEVDAAMRKALMLEVNRASRTVANLNAAWVDHQQKDDPAGFLKRRGLSVVASASGTNRDETPRLHGRARRGHKSATRSTRVNLPEGVVPMREMRGPRNAA